LNIALVNELAILFEKLGIDTHEVLKAAASKWNFLPFSPGLVGGHCIGVDPYYLTYKAQQVGHQPEVILAGRRINDAMGFHVAERVIRLMLSKRIHIIDSNILILGLTFKENCPDTRNSRVRDIVSTLQSYHTKVDVYDPWVDQQESELLIADPAINSYDAVIIAVAHTQFITLGIDKLKAFGKANSVVFDVKHLFPSSAVDGSL
jgi:UDP-N-acetyl-D-galactosamine dehydrogenase